MNDQTSRTPVQNFAQPDLAPLSAESNPGSRKNISAANGLQANEVIHLPHPTNDESEGEKRWFERDFFRRIRVQEFLNIAVNLREGEHTCRFGRRISGTLHVVIFIEFDDGLQWVVKIPKWNVDEGEENMFLMSEYATLVFLQKIETIPTPQVYGKSFTSNNPTKTPYYIMEKLPGLPLWQAVRGKKFEKEAVFEMLRQLAQVRKTLGRHVWHQIGSLTMSRDERRVMVEKQLTDSNYHDGWSQIRTRPGPFSSSLRYYANLLQESWSEVQKTLPESEDARLRWKIHAYLSSLLPSYVKPVKHEFFLAHTDLHSSNLLVDPKTGSITGIIDWEFACTVPFQAAEHFPVLLQRDAFMDDFDGIYDDPETEFNEWRAFYAEQFEADPAMEEYLQNIDVAIVFEDILKESALITVENLVERCKSLISAEALEKTELPFPWKSLTKERSPPPMTKSDPASTTKNEMAGHAEQISHDESPTTNDGDDKITISPSQIIHTNHDERPAPPTEKVETLELFPDISPTTTGVDVHSTFSLSPIIHTGCDETTDAIESTGAISFESRSLNSFVGSMQCRRGLKIGLVGGIKNISRRVKSGGMAVWRVCVCRIKRSGEESEKQIRRDV